MKMSSNILAISWPVKVTTIAILHMMIQHNSVKVLKTFGHISHISVPLIYRITKVVNNLITSHRLNTKRQIE